MAILLYLLIKSKIIFNVVVWEVGTNLLYLMKKAHFNILHISLLFQCPITSFIMLSGSFHAMMQIKLMGDLHLQSGYPSSQQQLLVPQLHLVRKTNVTSLVQSLLTEWPCQKVPLHVSGFHWKLIKAKLNFCYSQSYIHYGKLISISNLLSRNNVGTMERLGCQVTHLSGNVLEGKIMNQF